MYVLLTLRLGDNWTHCHAEPSSSGGGGSSGSGGEGGPGQQQAQEEQYWRVLGLKISKDDIVTITAALAISYGIRW